MDTLRYNNAQPYDGSVVGDYIHFQNIGIIKSWTGADTDNDDYRHSIMGKAFWLSQRPKMII